MQFSPVIKNKKSITIKDCSKLMRRMKEYESIDQFVNDTGLHDSQIRFLWCIVHKY